MDDADDGDAAVAGGDVVLAAALGVAVVVGVALGDAAGVVQAAKASADTRTRRRITSS